MLNYILLDNFLQNNVKRDTYTIENFIRVIIKNTKLLIKF